MHFKNGRTDNKFIKVRSSYSSIYNVNTRFPHLQKGDCKTTTTMESHNTEKISFLVPFFNFFYYFLLVPFKTVLDRETNQYRIQSHLLHKIVCPFLHIGWVCFCLFFWLLVVLNFQEIQDPSIVLLFDFVSNLAACASTVLTIFIFWMRREHHLNLIECSRVTVNDANTIKYLIYLAIVTSSAVWGIISWFLFHDSEHYGSLYSFDRNLGERNTSSHLIGNDSLNIPEFALYVGLNVLLVQMTLLYYVAVHGFFLMLVLSLGQLGRNFVTELKTMDIQKGTELYRSLKRKTEAIKNMYGNILLAYYLTVVCYYAEAPHVLMGKRGDAEKASMVYFGLTSVIWILAADFHKTIQETVLKWITFHTANPNLSIEDRLKLIAISKEMSTDPVALSSRYFCVTYEQLSAMLGLVVTYGIIVFQLHNGTNCKETCEA